MVPLASLVIQPPLAPSSYVPVTRLAKRPTSSYSHISSFRSLLLDMQIYSPNIKVVKQSCLELSHSLPVFSEQDKIEGKVILDPSCSQHGRLTISLEGAFEYSSVRENVDDDCKYIVKRYRHVFLSSSAAVPFSPSPDTRSTLREALSVRKRPSTSSLNSLGSRFCDFSFELPHGVDTREEIPWTFSCKTPTGNSRGGGELGTEELQITYQITAVWEATDGSENQTILEAPLIIQPDTDFQSVDCSTPVPESWLEMPLIPERSIPFACAVTLPSPRSFSRCSSIPYFVVFSTNTRSPYLVKEIAADATIAVSLIRKIFVNPQHTLQSPVLPDTPPASDDSDSQTPSFSSRSRLLKRSTSSRAPTRSHSPEDPASAQKPLPPIPQEAFSASRTLETQISIGFPKRPRTNSNASPNLPDGLYRGKIQLSRDLLPSVELTGFSVKYYLDVSVLFGQDDVRARIPVKIY